MTGYLSKAPAEEKNFLIDWPDLGAGETLTTSLGWSVLPDEVAPDGLTVLSDSFSGQQSEAVLSGGRAGSVYHVAHRVRTSELRVLVRSFLVRVVEA